MHLCELALHFAFMSADKLKIYIPALMQGKFEALLVASAAANPSVQALQNNDAVHLLSITRSDAYTRRMDALSSVRLPQGACAAFLCTGVV